MPSVPIRVAVVDDHPMFRIGLAAAIGEMEGIVLVGEAERSDQVEALVVDTRPDVLLLDVRLPDASGLEVNRWMAQQHPAVKVIMLTMSDDGDTALTALRDGASGYLVKGAGPQSVEHAVRAAVAGDVVLDHALVQQVVGLPGGREPSSDRRFPQLTPREFTILELIAEGFDNSTIARRLVLSPKTVRNYVSIVMVKVHASDRAHAVVLARRAGLGS